MSIYMKYEGIDGGRPHGGKYDRHWIELKSCQFGTCRRVTDATGRGMSREAAVPDVRELVITKELDEASSALFKASLWGEGRHVTIDFTRGSPPAPYLRLELDSVLISSYSIEGAGGSPDALPQERMSLNCAKIVQNPTAN